MGTDIHGWVRTPCDTSACVEVSGAGGTDAVSLRQWDGTREHGHLTISRAEWVAFRDAIKDGHFDGV